MSLSFPASTSAPSQHPDISGLWAELRHREPVFAGMALLLLALIPPTLVAMALDDRTFQGINVWIKPLKFQTALVIYLATLAWFAGWLPQEKLASRRYRLFSLSVVVAIALEIVWITGWAANGIGSQFNTGSVLMEAIYGLMGLLALLLTSASLVYGIMFLSHVDSPLPSAFRLSLALGLIFTFILTVLAAGALSMQPNHWVGAPVTDAGGSSLFGWSRSGGDLRVAHFFATHAMHVIPLTGFLAARLLPEAPARAVVHTSAAAFIAFVAFVFLQAWNGLPFLPDLI